MHGAAFRELFGGVIWEVCGEKYIEKLFTFLLVYLTFHFLLSFTKDTSFTCVWSLGYALHKMLQIEN
jgi:hypothetical protein